MTSSRRVTLNAFLPATCVMMLACTDGPGSPVALLSPRSASVSAASLTGRIVYTLQGQLHIYNVATRNDVSLGVSGVNPKFSPDGSLITYQSRGLRVMNSDGTNSRLLASTGGVPSFDPTGTVIAYNDNGIWKINVDGTGSTQLSSDGRQPAWSPDGTRIAYHAYVNGAEQLFLMNADGTNRNQALNSATIIDIVWQPSGRILFGLLASRGNYEIYSFDPAVPASLIRLTTANGNDFEPSWSPDAAAVSWTSGSGGIWLMNSDGSGAQVAIVSSKARQGSWGR